MQLRVSAGPPQIIAVTFQVEARVASEFSAGIRNSEALAPCCSTRETSASLVCAGLADCSSTRTVTCIDSLDQVAGLGTPAFKSAAAIRPCCVIDAELTSTGSCGVSLITSGRALRVSVAALSEIFASDDVAASAEPVFDAEVFTGRWTGAGQRCCRSENPWKKKESPAIAPRAAATKINSPECNGNGDEKFKRVASRFAAKARSAPGVEDSEPSTKEAVKKRESRLRR
jgi:hypothetical protein